MKRRVPFVVLVLAGVVTTCRNELAPSATGAIALEIRLAPESSTGVEKVPAPSAASLSASAGLDSARARAQGPTTKTVSLRLVGGFWEGTLDELLPGSYCVTVEGFSGGGLDRSGETCGVLVRAGETSQGAVTLALVRPTNLTATATSGSEVSLAWTDNASNEEGFRIERCAGAGCTTFAEIATVGPNVTTYANVSLTAGISYSFRVRSYTAAGNSGYSNTATVPVAPSGLAATPISGTQINLAWTDNASDEVGFRIERCTGSGCMTFVEIATVGANVTTYQDAGLTAGETYRYRVRAHTAAGTSDYSTPASATEPTVPAAPTSLTSTPVSATQVDLAWTDNATNEDGFRIERCAGTGCTTFAAIATVGPNVTAYTNPSLTAGTTYAYRVRAYNVAGNSGYSNTATAMPPTVPATPTALTATGVSGTRIDLAWTDVAANEDGFRIERCAGAACANFTEIATVGPNVTAYTNPSLTAGTSYSYRVRAYNLAGNSGYSNMATVPVAPSGLVATPVSGTRIDLAWTDNATDEVGFRIERCAGSGCTSFVEIATVGANATTYQNAGLTAGETYGYRVRAYAAGGSSAYSPVASATSPTAPVAPTGLTATAVSGTEVDLVWTDNASNEDGFRIERCQGASCTGFVEIATVGANVSTYQNTGLTAGTSYSYRVRAYNLAGNSAYSNTVSATPASVPVAPTGLSASGTSGTQIDLVWFDNSNNENGFRIERCDGLACATFVEIATAAANATTYQNTGLTAGIGYSYRIRAYNAAGNSGYSNTAIVPVAPTTLTATAISGTEIDLAWVDNAADEDGFRIEQCQGANCSSFAEVARVGPNVTAYQSRFLATGTSYSYRVLAYTATGTSQYSNTATGTTPLQPPSALTATALSVSEIDLAWLDNASNEDGYRIERCAGVGCAAFAEIATVGPNVTTYASTGLTTGTAYSYRVRAYNVTGNSGYSNVAIVPVAPTTLTATAVSGAEIDLAWTDNATDEDGFRIESCSGVGCTTFGEVATVGPNVTSYQSSFVAAGTSYSFRVRAYTAAGTSSYSNTATAATPLPPPNALTATAVSASQINLAWSDNAFNEDGFRIEQCTGPACTTFAEIATVGPNVTTYANPGLTAGTSYSYRVRAYNVTGNSGYSNVAVVPVAPTTLTATAVSGTEIDLAWTDNATDEDGFRIEYCTGVGCTAFSEIATVGANVTTYQHLFPAAGTSHSYRVRAHTAAGTSVYSNTATAVIPLPAPTNLTATAVSGTQINLAWADNSFNEDGFRIERCAGPGCTTFAEIATVGPNVTTYASTGLTAGTGYSYRVRAYNVTGNSGYSNVAVVPVAPTTLTATTVSGTQIDLAWTDNATDEDGFRIEYCTGPGCTTFSEIATVGANVTTYQHLFPAAGTSHSYRVRAHTASGTSVYSNTATAVIPLPTPTNLTATAVSGTQINLTWSDNSFNEDGFRIERCAGPGCTTFAEIATVGPNVTAYANTALTPGTGYSYRVRAYNVTGNSGYSIVAVVPVAPTNLTATAGSGTQVDLAWTDNATDEDGFRIEYCTGVGCTTFSEIATVGANVTTYQHFVSAGTSNTYRVLAHTAAGTSVYSNTATAVVALPAPTNLTAAAVSTTQINLAWTDNAFNEDGFRIERCIGAGCTTFGEIATVGPNVTTYANTGLVLTNSYSYRVRAYNVAGTSAYSNTATATNLLPASPANLSATTISPSQIDLAWTDRATNEDGFRIEQCVGTGCTIFTEIATVGADVTTYQNTGLTFNTSYTYRVRAYNAAGSSTYSNTATATTISPAAPTSLVATGVSSSQISLTWQDNASTEDGFRIERCEGVGCGSFAEITTIPQNVTTYQDPGLTLGASYSYRVRAYNAAGPSGYSNVATAIPVDLAAPTNLTATTVSSTRIDLAWTDNASNEDGFRIEQCAGVGCTFFQEIATVGANVTTYQNTVGGTFTLSYRVRAYNVAGTSAYSNVATTTTFAPAPPTNLTATTVSASQINLAWTDRATNEDGFRIERCSGAGCAVFTEIVTAGANATTYQNTGLSASTSYSYRMRAYNGAGPSAYSNTATATTPSCDCWTTRTSMPTARSNLAAGVVNGSLYAVGGFLGNSLATLEAYDPASDMWTTRASMPTARYGLGVGVVNGILYAVGGNGGSAVGTVEAYDPITDTWTAKASMPTGRYYLGGGVVNGILYAVGGAGAGGGVVGTVEAYDPITDTWTTKASLPTARYGVGVGVVNGILYAVGGFSAAGSALMVVDAYDPATDTWTRKASMPTTRGRLAVGVVNGILYAVGGYSPDILATVEAYDPATDTWTTKPSMPTARYALAAGVVNGILYAVGGDGGFATVRTVEAYQP